MSVQLRLNVISSLYPSGSTALIGNEPELIRTLEYWLLPVISRLLRYGYKNNKLHIKRKYELVLCMVGFAKRLIIPYKLRNMYAGDKARVVVGFHLDALVVRTGS